MDNRKELLESLLDLNRPIVEIVNELNKFPWDYTGEKVLVTNRHIRTILELYLSSSMKNSSIEKWANIIECREDLDFENEELKEIIETIANPILYGELDVDMAKTILKRIN